MQKEFFTEMCVEFVTEMLDNQSRAPEACTAEVPAPKSPKKRAPKKQRQCDECYEWHEDVHRCMCGYQVCGWCKRWHDENTCGGACEQDQWSVP